MSAFGGLLLTNKGRNLQAKAQAGVPLIYTRIGLGDGQLGTSPIFELNSLKNEVMSLPIGKLKVINSTNAVIGTVLNNSSIASGFYFREIGVFATDPDIGEILYCYGNAGTAAEYIPPGGGADLLEKAIDVQVMTGNASNISAVINQSLIFETPEGAQEKVELGIATHEADYLSHTGYAVATGEANAYIATLSPALLAYAESVSLRLKINVTNTGASTVNVNGLGAKSIKKSNGNNVAAGNLKAGSIYTLTYDGTSFILQGEGGEYGNATAGDVVAPKTIGTENGLVTGTIVEQPAWQAPKSLAVAPGNLYVRHPLGAYRTPSFNGDAEIVIVDNEFVSENFLADKNVFGLQGAIPNYSPYPNNGAYVGAVGAKGDGQTSLTINPKTGYYKEGVNGGGYGPILIVEPSYIPSNIRKGISMFGVLGTLDASSMGGANRYASGTVQPSSSQLPFRRISDYSNTTSLYHASVSLDFEPDLIFLIWSNTADTGTSNFSIYMNNHDRWARSVIVGNASYYTTGGNGVSSVYRGDTDNAYVNSTGFRLPVTLPSGYLMKWVAIKY